MSYFGSYPYGYGWTPMQQGYPGGMPGSGPGAPSGGWAMPSVTTDPLSATYGGQIDSYFPNLTQSTAPSFASAFPVAPATSSFSSLAQNAPQTSSLEAVAMLTGSILSMLMVMLNALIQKLSQAGALGSSGSSLASSNSQNPYLPSWFSSALQPSSSDNSNSTSSSASAAPTQASGLVSGAGVTQNESMRRLAAAGITAANRLNSTGKCLKGVNDALEDAGLGIERKPSAYMAAKVLADDSRFTEIQVAKDELKNLPPGCIIVWAPTATNEHGHIAITQANGKESSDHIQNLIIKGNDTEWFRVFIPK